MLFYPKMVSLQQTVGMINLNGRTVDKLVCHKFAASGPQKVPANDQHVMPDTGLLSPELAAEWELARNASGDSMSANRGLVVHWECCSIPNDLPWPWTARIRSTASGTGL